MLKLLSTAARSSLSLPRRRSTVAIVRPTRSTATTPSPPPIGRRPAKTLSLGRSRTEPLSFGINEYGCHDLDFDISGSYRIIGADTLSDPLRPARKKTYPDPVTERGAERRRGHVALVRLGRRRSAACNEMCTGAKARRRIDRLQSDESGPLRIDQRRPRGHDAADIVLFGRHHTAKAKIAGDRVAVQFITRDMPLFDAQDRQRFGAVGNHAEILARVHQRVRERLAISRRHRDLVGEFAGKRDAEQSQRNWPEQEFAACKIRKCLVGKI